MILRRRGSSLMPVILLNIIVSTISTTSCTLFQLCERIFHQNMRWSYEWHKIFAGPYLLDFMNQTNFNDKWHICYPVVDLILPPSFQHGLSISRIIATRGWQRAARLARRVVSEDFGAWAIYDELAHQRLREFLHVLTYSFSTASRYPWVPCVRLSEAKEALHEATIKDDCTLWSDKQPFIYSHAASLIVEQVLVSRQSACWAPFFFLFPKLWLTFKTELLCRVRGQQRAGLRWINRSILPLSVRVSFLLNDVQLSNYWWWMKRYIKPEYNFTRINSFNILLYPVSRVNAYSVNNLLALKIADCQLYSGIRWQTQMIRTILYMQQRGHIWGNRIFVEMVRRALICRLSLWVQKMDRWH